MEKIIFIVGYTGDIGTKLMEIAGKDNFCIIPVSSRNSLENIQNLFTKNISNPYNQYIFVNAVGTGVYGMFHELKKEDFIKSFEGNYLVPISIIQLFTKSILELVAKNKCKSNSCIININSKSALEPFFQGSAYNSMKSAISMNIKIIAKEYAKYGLKTKEFFPGVIQTKMNQDMPYMPKSGIQTSEQFAEEVIDFIKNI